MLYTFVCIHQKLLVQVHARHEMSVSQIKNTSGTRVLQWLLQWRRALESFKGKYELICDFKIIAIKIELIFSQIF